MTLAVRLDSPHPTVEHALFFCTCEHALSQCRADFIEVIKNDEPRVLNVSPWNATKLLKSLIFRRDTACRVPKYVHRVFAIINDVPMVWPDGV
jgi:hypothetical protein